VTGPLEDAVEALARGELVIFPTDTVYGLAARPDEPSATARLFEAKRRPQALTLPVLVGSMAQARTVARFDERAERLSAAWPGPLTVVLPRTQECRGWELGGEARTVGVRMPHHPLALALLARSGPLAVTSANLSGEPPAREADSLAAAFGEKVAVYLCEEAPLVGAASTVIDLTGTEPRILRAGAMTEVEIFRFLDGKWPLLDSRPSP
jgi:tRNA threonylcarbamoyl adenosine modification protein (Sua5/YciO/YrdC/YwlC family)